MEIHRTTQSTHGGATIFPFCRNCLSGEREGVGEHETVEPAVEPIAERGLELAELNWATGCKWEEETA